MTGFTGSVQSFSGAAASEMLGTLFGPGGAEAIAEMKAARPAIRPPRPRTRPGGWPGCRPSGTAGC